MAFALVLMIVTETFPLSVTAISAGIIEALAQVGSLLGPVVITLCIDWQIYPLIVLSFVALFTISLPMYFFSEKRPEEVEDIEKLLKD